MNSFALRPADDRALHWRDYSNRAGVPEFIVEKDFWVCWLLGHIFATPQLGAECVFKGGTSLSKVFHAIDRFARHHSDFAALWRHRGGEAAANCLTVLEFDDVVATLREAEHKINGG